MSLISFRHVHLGYGAVPLLDRESFALERGERVCLVGRNGTGKSTLLKLVTGEILPDDGEIIRAQGLRIAQLAQEVPLGTSGSVYHVVADGLGKVGALLERFHRLTHELPGGEAQALAELERVQHELEAADGWMLHQRVNETLSRLQLDAVADQDIAALSGGLKRRVMLARALVTAPDLLLLDEPTNHLDIDAIVWLEEFLLNYSGTLLFVTHDRAFLQRLATRIIELDRGRLTDFPGDYAKYQERKQALLAAENTANALFDKKLAQEEAWIRQGIEARRTRNEGRVRALKKLREDFAARRVRAGATNIHVQEAERSGRLVIEATDVSFSFEQRAIIKDLTATILRGDKVGIIGPNGCGKTTLLRLLLGELTPSSGQLRVGTNRQIAYFDQYRVALDEEKSVQDNVGEGSDQIMVNGAPRHVIGYLQDFLFAPERARQPVKALSGGERNRLLLAKLFARPANVLVLDEPTNDLDAETLDLLEERLIEFSGTVLLVSHDRAFLNNVVTSTLAYEGEGRFREYVGGFSDWQRQRTAPPSTAGNPSHPDAKPVADTPSAPRAATRKRSYKESRELSEIPKAIERLETERGGLQAQLSDPAFYQKDKAAIAATQKRLADIDETLARTYARWEELENLGG